MLLYIGKRLLQAVPILLIITILCFLCINLAPYDAVDAAIDPKMSREEIEAKREQLGLGDPMPVQYGRWLSGLVRGDLGYSLINRTSIREDLSSRIPATIQLVLPAYVTAFLLAILLGLVAASRQNRLVDKLIDGLCAVGIATPTFWFGLLVMYFMGYKWGWFPLMGMRTIGGQGGISDYLSHLAMPYLVLVIGYLPGLTRYVRSSACGQLGEEYVMVQHAFGNKPSAILLRHVSRNALLPLITRLGMDIPALITGAVVTETIFAWPGMGSYFIKAVQSLDYPIVMSVLILSGALVIVGNLLADVLYGIVDPRIRR